MSPSATPRIVLFGATGYTGKLTAEVLVRLGAKPVLAGRNAESLQALATELGGDLETATADVSQPETVRALLETGDVMLSTVGPFTHWGDAAAEAAIAARGPYIDSTGEPPFIRKVFTEFGPRAQEAGSPMITAAGYDWVPGNLAAALALSEAGKAGDEATKVEIGCFILGKGETNGFSGGTMASTIAALLESGFAWKGGRLVTERNAKNVRNYDIKGKQRQAISTSSSEHFTIPRLFKQVTDVQPFLGWFGPMSRPMQIGGAVTSATVRVPGMKTALSKGLGRFAKGSTGGPDADERSKTSSYIRAIARNADGEELATVDLQGVNPYTFTADFLAWAAICAQQGGIEGNGALGPAEAFSIEGLTEGVAAAGITRV